MHRTLGLQAVSVTGEFDFLSLAKPSLIGRAAEPETPQRGGEPLAPHPLHDVTTHSDFK